MRAPRSVRTLVALARSALRAHPALLVGLTSAAVVPAVSLVAPSVAMADDLEVGTQLTALADVQLNRAVVAKGSRVEVFKLSKKQGRIERVDVQLADGHVVHGVSIAMIRTSFRVAED